VFKEFGGTSFNEIPIVPITDYSVKAKILDTWVTNFTDVLDDIIANGDFTIPNTNGTAPQGWTLSPSPGIVYDSANNKINFNQTTDRLEFMLHQLCQAQIGRLEPRIEFLLKYQINLQ
jgi:hypothetical protein